ncbi:MAG: hypothetical protein PUP90_20170 [Nostoc sp. S4]|nr:hypothetical protein [Nostoc sp. S4]
MRNFQQSLFSLTLLPVVIASGGINDWGLGIGNWEDLNKHSDSNRMALS